ncbi:MAG: hypothetical protein MAG715_01094 [Methanonatronarchaeales archaeon]|nr:hypothetical protein [Methanonatronarchaeales archaeon]
MSFRLLHVSVPGGLADRVEEALATTEASFDRFDGEESVLFVAYAAVEKVEEVTDLLDEAGIGDSGFISISSTEALISERAEEAERKAKSEGERERVAREELMSDARSMSSISTNFLALTAVSSVIATAGIIADSTAVVIGAMVIAPLIGPAIASSIGTVLGDPDTFSRGILAEAAGLLVAVASSAVSALLIYTFIVAPPVDLMSLGQVAERAFPTLLNVAVALGAGVAGALSLTTGVSAALVGVMIAVALIPPASTVGVGLALGDNRVTLGAAVLLLVNVFSIHLAGTLTFRYQGYAPSGFFERIRSKKVIVWRAGLMFAILFLLSTALAFVTYDSYDNAVFEREVQGALTEPGVTIAEDGSVRLKSFSVAYRTELFGFVREPSSVEVRVGLTGASPPNLVDRVAADIRTRTGRDVQVLLETSEVEVAG